MVVFLRLVVMSSEAPNPGLGSEVETGVRDTLGCVWGGGLEGLLGAPHLYPRHSKGLQDRFRKSSLANQQEDSMSTGSLRRPSL